MGNKKVKDVHTNYDHVFKEALTLFKDKTLDFLGLHGIAPIAEPLSTENTEVFIRSEFADLTFALQDGRGIHFEEEVQLSKDDMMRIASYYLWLSREYKREFITVIFVKEPTMIKALETELMVFKPPIVECSKIDGDALLAKLKKEITENREINELELIYLPLFSSKKFNPTELFMESTAIIKHLHIDDERRMKLFALSILLAGKVVDKTQLDLLWEEVKLMNNVLLEYAEERGIKRGREEGMAKGRVEGRVEGRAEGRAEGITEGRAEIARKLLKQDRLIEEIIEITDLTREEIEALKEKD
ncbi:MAG: hypothetical protein LBV40_04275 [Methanomicrobiales archaeon]|jgi:hypothetical protein|nr:hypothetical protein [Methanomicrobiales archaeon]